MVEVEKDGYRLLGMMRGATSSEFQLCVGAEARASQSVLAEKYGHGGVSRLALAGDPGPLGWCPATVPIVTDALVDDLSEVFAAVGYVVVAAGHVEHEMRHALARLRSTPDWDYSDLWHLDWAGLAKAIQQAASGRPDEGHIRAVMDVNRDLANRRNMAVHTAWTLDPAALPTVVGARAFRSPHTPATIVAQLQDFTDTGRKLYAFREQIRAIAADAS